MTDTTNASQIIGQSGDHFLTNIIPRDTKVTCEPGYSFNWVSSVKELERVPHDEYACVLELGVVPSDIPAIGTKLEGDVLTITQTSLWKPFAETVWKGKLMREISCDDGSSRKPLIVNDVIGGTDFFYAVPYIGGVTSILNPNEAPVENRDYFVLDYRGTVNEYCNRTEADAEIDGFENDDLYIASIYPLNTVIDAMRIVGQDGSGNAIFLGRTLIKQWSTNDYFTIAWFSLTVKGLEFTHEDAEQILTTKIEHEEPGLRDSISKLFHDGGVKFSDERPEDPWSINSWYEVAKGTAKDIGSSIKSKLEGGYNSLVSWFNN